MLGSGPWSRRGITNSPRWCTKCSSITASCRFSRWPKPFPEPTRQEEDIEVAFEIEVCSPNDRKTEIDVAVRHGTSLWLGEATTKDHFEHGAAKEQSRLERLAEVATLLAARGVLMATSATFRPTTATRINAVLQGTWPELRIEERVKTMPSPVIATSADSTA